MASVSARDIRSDIETRIARGDLGPGERLPSVRALADELGISPATVSSAYRDLRQRGMVIGRGRQGTRVAPARSIEPGVPVALAADLVDASHGSPDLATLPPLGPALQFAASLPQPRYGGELVAPLLRGAAADLFGADGIDATHLTVTSGAMDAVERVLSALELRIGDRIGVEDPGHIPVHQLARSLGLDLVPLQVDDEGITPDSLARALDSNLAAIVITPRAQNPTGAALTAARAAALTKQLKPHPATAVIQDDHAGLISGVPYHSVAAPGPRWATMRSLGKSFGPDVRLALLVGDEQTMHRVSTGLSNGPGWVSFILQRLAAHLLTDADTRTLVTSAATNYAARRDRLIIALRHHGIAASGASGLNVWIPTTHEASAVEAARRAGYAIRSAAPYRINSSPAVRVTISNLANNDIDAIAEALARLVRPTVVAHAV